MSRIQVVMHPNEIPMSFGQFIERSEGYSVAIDGYVKEGPSGAHFGPDGLPRENWNHHEGCHRPATLATCQQALMAIRTDFFETFRDKNGRRVNIYANDCDEDVCATIFCLTQSHLVEGTINPAINRYIAVSGIMDVTGGAYPYPPDLPFLEEHTWTVEPYLRFRASGGLRDRRTAEDFTLVTEQVCHRILEHVMGRGKRLPLETDYEVVHRGSDWCMVKETGTRARLRMFDDGIRAYVSIAEGSNGNIYATVGRFSSYTRFPVQAILERYNLEEGLGPNDDRAGGSNLIGGTSRKNGTKHKIPDLIRLTEETTLASLRR
jgi:hypothetical protein